ncbi:MAG: hypothetical protein K0R72_955 [Clostridia bacterium]|nr:hypothetical protein [Clostridia bacterium]
MIIIINKSKIRLTAISKNVSTVKEIKIIFDSNSIQDILSIAYVSKLYIDKMRDNGTKDLITLNNKVLILAGKKIKFIIKKNELLKLLSEEFNIRDELLLGYYIHKINNNSTKKELYYFNKAIYEKSK